MKHILFLLLISISFVAFGQKPCQQDRTAWMREMQKYKNEYIAKQLELTEAQQAKFFPIYNKMDKEVRVLLEDCRKMDENICKRGDKVTNLEYEKAAEAAFEIEIKKGEAEMKYYKQFKTILTPKQLFKLKGAERDFMKLLMQHHRELKKRK